MADGGVWPYQLNLGPIISHFTEVWQGPDLMPEIHATLWIY